jgi:hypothetical protein
MRPHVSPSLAASFADEPRFQIGEPDVIGPLVRADRDRMATVKVRAIDQEAVHGLMPVDLGHLQIQIWSPTVIRSILAVQVGAKAVDHSLVKSIAQKRRKGPAA